MTPNQTTKTVTKFLYQGYISIFGGPSQTPEQLGCKLYEQHYWSDVQTPECEEAVNHASPQTNGLVERSHQTIMWMIGKLGEDKKMTGQVTWLR